MTMMGVLSVSLSLSPWICEHICSLYYDVHDYFGYFEMTKMAVILSSSFSDHLPLSLSLSLSLPLSPSGLNDTYSEDNSDTVGQIVHYIMKNEGSVGARE